MQVSKYINFLLDEMNVDKHAFKWVYSLCKYGDVYLKLFRESEYSDELFEEEKQRKTTLQEEVKENEEKDTLNEDVIAKVYSKDDRYSHYIEMVPNPAEMFELTQLGKTYAYIQAPIAAAAVSNKNDMMNMASYRYIFKKNDIKLYDAVSYVHACLEDNSSRTPEEIQIFKTDNIEAENNNPSLIFSVRRGQSLLYNSFKV